MMLAIGIDKDKQKGGRLHDGVSFNAFIIGHDERGELVCFEGMWVEMNG